MELMFDLDKIVFNNNLTVGEKRREFLKLRTFHKQLLDEIVDFCIFCSRNF